MRKLQLQNPRTQSSSDQQSISGESWHQSGWRTSFLLVSHSWQVDQWQETTNPVTTRKLCDTSFPLTLPPSVIFSVISVQWCERTRTLCVPSPAGLVRCIIHQPRGGNRGWNLWRARGSKHSLSTSVLTQTDWNVSTFCKIIPTRYAVDDWSDTQVSNSANRFYIIS